MQHLKLAGLFFMALIAGGCASVAPSYSPNTMTISSEQGKQLSAMSVGKFTEANDSVNKVSVRAATLVSPYGASYAQYLQQALQDDLNTAGLLKADSAVQVSGELLEYTIHGSGISRADAVLSARFVVNKDGKESYNKVHTIQHDWASSFVGAIAFKNAEKNISPTFQKLIRAFLTDANLK